MATIGVAAFLGLFGGAIFYVIYLGLSIPPESNSNQPHPQEYTPPSPPEKPWYYQNDRYEDGSFTIHGDR